MPTVTVIVKGIAICYSKGNLWKVLFPVNANEHVVKFTGPNNQNVPLALEGRTIDIRIGSNGSSFQTNPSAFHRYFDLTGPKAHDEIEPTAKKGVLLSIEGAEFSMAYGETDCRFELLEKGKLVDGPRTIGYAARFTLSGDGITMSINPPESSISGSLSSNCELIFDNTCPGRELPDNADFVMAYDVIRDAVVKGRQLEMARHSMDQPGVLDMFLWRLKKLGGSATARGENPAIGEPGLPCNAVVTSKSAKLP